MRKEGVGNGNLTGFAIVLDREFDPDYPYHSVPFLLCLWQLPSGWNGRSRCGRGMRRRERGDDPARRVLVCSRSTLAMRLAKVGDAKLIPQSIVGATDWLCFSGPRRRSRGIQKLVSRCSRRSCRSGSLRVWPVLAVLFPLTMPGCAD